MSLSVYTRLVDELDKSGRLQPPKLRRLLSSSRPLGVEEIAAACMDDLPDSDLRKLPYEEVHCIACWGLEHLGEDQDALELAAVCEGVALVADELGITDPLLRFECNVNLLVALAEFRKGNRDGDS